jgi:hypothetical protein|uniref:Uncharacterized protein n=1 Tax=viral metagenome TaxID=1070528 RepID=A0A6C0HCC7_9ZZZZ
MDDTENITYYFDDIDDITCETESTNSELALLLNEFEQINANNSNSLYNEDDILSEIKNYELNYTIKQLLLICEYYGLTKQTKTAEYYGAKARTMKKNDIISLIIMYEKNVDNIETVMKRKELWFYLDSLKADKIMKKFVLW